MTPKTLIDSYPNWDAPDVLNGGGVFKDLVENFRVPWESVLESSLIDLEYFGNISGNKRASPLLRKLANEDGYIGAVEREKLAGIIYSLYGKNWEMEWATVIAEYNPIENYSMIETMEDDTTEITYGKTHTRTDNLTNSKTGTDTIRPNLTETDTPNITETITPGVVKTSVKSKTGFNSSDLVTTDSQTDTPTGHDTQLRTGTNTVTKTGTEATEYNSSQAQTGTVTDADTGKDTHRRNYTLTRSGNIGVTTSQQMLQSSRDLYMWSFFETVVFPDVDRVLATRIY